jgi:hypothetical protein
MPPLPSYGVPGASTSVLGITAATALRTSGAWLVTISVVSAGTAGAVYDSPTTATTAGKQIGVIPNTVGLYTFNWPCASGLVVSPGASQNLSVSLA